jgi:hypothetical protein
MGAVLIFVWNATRGSRLRPWRSEFLKWRMETFTGRHADEIRVRDFVRFLYNERKQVMRYLRWLSEMRSYAHAGEKH